MKKFLFLAVVLGVAHLSVLRAADPLYATRKVEGPDLAGPWRNLSPALKRYVISDLGAKGDGATVNTQAIQKAIDQCAANGGGVLVVPAGTFLSGALYFKQGVNLLVEKDGILKSTVDRAEFTPVYTRWEGIERFWTPAFLNFFGMKNIEVSGEGLIDGSGKEWNPNVGIRMGTEGAAAALAGTPFASGAVIDNTGANGANGRVGRGVAATAPGALSTDDMNAINNALRALLSENPDAKKVLESHPDYPLLRNGPAVIAPGRQTGLGPQAGAGRGAAIIGGPDSVARYYTGTLPSTATPSFAPNPASLPPVNAAGVVIPGGGGLAPPRTLVFQNCDNVRVTGLNFLNPARWCVVFIYTNHVLAENLNIRVPLYLIPSSDSMDIDSCQHVLVTGCFFEANDDCISIKSGKDEDGLRVNLPTEDVIIEKSHFAYGQGGAAMGSETSGGIRRVIVRDCLFSDGNWAPIRFKSQPSRGGVVEDITYANITLDNTLKAVEFNLAWSAGNGVARDTGTVLPIVRDVHIVNVHGTAKTMGGIAGLPGSPIENVVFENCDITAGNDLKLTDTKDINVDGLHLTIDPSLSPPARGAGRRGPVPAATDPAADTAPAAVDAPPQAQ